ncbi:hypothetical protein BHE74_00026895 [Ensete ventricosum]|nr:hypothetical protein BHE74_00026895 [Ensete ventricosum]RZS03565.1 hypothetical protein BHM03_00033787 [Ensete ventricosum]
MKFKEGDRVEVFRRNEEPYGSWFPSKVLSVDVVKCAVRCELSATPDGRPIIEKVHERDVRPCPPHVPGTEHWMVGDIVEVFDAHSWRVGKIAKVLNDDYVVTKIFGSIQLKEFHVGFGRDPYRIPKHYRTGKVSTHLGIGFRVIALRPRALPRLHTRGFGGARVTISDSALRQ